MIVNHNPYKSPMNLGDVPASVPETIAVGEPAPVPATPNRVEDLSVFLSLLSSLFLIMRN